LTNNSISKTATADGWLPLHVQSAGLCCAVGYSLAAASCALRAGMDHFQESDFVDRFGSILHVARLPLGDLWGARRLAQIVSLCIQDCAVSAEAINPASTALLVLAAEADRPHSDPEYGQQLYRACEDLFEFRFHDASAVIPLGRAGIGEALWQAQKLLRIAGSIKQVLLVGADTLLDAATIEHYLDQERLQCSGNSNGFIPGEGAAALLLKLANETSQGLHILGIGQAAEQSRPDGEIPNKAVGLTKAIREACACADIAPNALQLRMTDQNGEQYFAKEAANAYTRIMAKDGVGLPLFHIADCVGETGAAAGPISLAYLSTLLKREDGPGKTALLHFANDDGLRSALIVQER
jgi:3-oxoacyl-[acyl-carrier-protein] synthase I